MNRLFHRLQELRLPASATTVSQRGWCVAQARFVAGLPALGNVLYVPMRPNGTTVRELPRGLLAEAMQLAPRSEEHTSELQSLMRITYAVFCLKKKTNNTNINQNYTSH